MNQLTEKGNRLYCPLMKFTGDRNMNTESAQANGSFYLATAFSIISLLIRYFSASGLTDDASKLTEAIDKATAQRYVLITPPVMAG